ncbi:D-alanyl-D-alanine carboxypeptidase family protein [Acaryochloris sp. 'Moss Beach']|uniref:M15 family metallopeptidase n=1 Tax=Acaryochloris sp. 'Moss Beach' TaxID=2740837 RepID=UPI001F46294E|nr:M15 family metallopeptidase [Acaryochloris sp. 'Moss Beach']UJB69762.1 D-alanyl-D-alanine carboxypeptidase family protein [Acaryochloris sp. 'Moss Beach']
MYDDIPEARRQTVPQTASSPARGNPALLIGSCIGLLVIAVGAAFAIGFFKPEPSQSKVENGPNTSPTGGTDTPSTPDTTLGHFSYKVAPENELQAITADNRIRLRSAAAQAYKQMSSAAAADGVKLQALSGFRTVDDQDYLFFKVKEERAQGAQQRAKVSAPPGRSEHHTGYAMDIGDATQTDAHVNVAFEETRAFDWLQKNAPRYSFELSFPKGNSQGVSYEPWHWRYVGDKDSLETFYNARNLKS